MKKFILSLTLILTVAFGAVLTLTRPAPVSARAETADSTSESLEDLENEDTSNYVENFLLPGEKITGKWIRLYTSSVTSLETTRLYIYFIENGNLAINGLNGLTDISNSNIIVKTNMTYVDFYIPEDSKFKMKPLGPDTVYEEYSFSEEEITSSHITARKLVKNNSIDFSDKSTWTEKTVLPGDKITGKWLRLYKQMYSSVAYAYGFQTTSFNFLYYNQLFSIQSRSNLSQEFAAIYRYESAQYVDFFIPEGTYMFLDENYSSLDEEVVVNTSKYVKELVAPVVEETDEPTSEPEDESTSESLPENESDVPGDESDESAIEDDSQKFIDKTTAWVNDNLGLSLTSSFVGAVLLVLIISFFINRAKK